MLNYFFTIGLVYLLIGFSMALIFFFVARKSFIGRFWGAALVGVTGAFIGGVIDFFFKDIIHLLANLKNTVNIFPPIIAAIVILIIFNRISDR